MDSVPFVIYGLIAFFVAEVERMRQRDAVSIIVLRAVVPADAFPVDGLAAIVVVRRALDFFC